MVELKQRLERVAQLLEAHLALQKGSPEQDGPNAPDVQDTP
ncbi:hypothetical protein WDZ92_15440 [Nostoc sp. NIES-2111]